MNINPISFGKTIKVVSETPLFSAHRIADIINNPLSCNPNEAEALVNIASLVEKDSFCKTAILDCKCYGEAQAVSFDYGKTAYVLTGEESRRLYELKQDKLFHIEAARRNYGYDSNMASIVKESENDRYQDLGRLLITETCDSAIDVNHTKAGLEVKSIDYIG